MGNKYIKNRVQLFNPISKHWVKLNTETGAIIGTKKKPFKGVKKFNRRDLFR